ncbi:MAG: hypothetical protein JWO94_1357 [Verrucomicrobiaceae bacterium]|nr:hypothetical protein [Verrucomicrobiaceae bacterium]
MKACRVAFLLIVSGLGVQAENEYENSPVNYSASNPHDAAQALEKAQVQGKVKLDRTDDWSVLHSLLQQFHIPEASQVMVFSKTSKQNNRISPATPRVVYFGDNAYVGYCLGGAIEVSVIDPRLGPVFYVTDPQADPSDPVRFTRDQSCLSCHGGPFSPDVPGVIVRSVCPSQDGHPITSQGSKVVDTTTPFEERWGGWYVTGRHGGLVHKGNVTAEEAGDKVKTDAAAGQNVMKLDAFFDTSPYPRKTSDIVALMVLEHQTSMQNILTKANQTAMRAMHMQKSLQKELHEPVLDEPVNTARRMIDHGAQDVVDGLLFKDEAALPAGGIEGSSGFQEQFEKNAPHTVEGRSLKDLQLLNRLFKHRCSYMIYSLTFANLVPQLKTTVFKGLWAALQGQDPQKRYAYLSASERRNIARILVETLPDAPLEWRRSVVAK